MPQARSFDGDLRMFDGVAAAAKQRGALGMLRAHTQPAVMPLCHLCDQHCYRGIGHVLNGGGASFGARPALFGIPRGGRRAEPATPSPARDSA